MKLSVFLPPQSVFHLKFELLIKFTHRQLVNQHKFLKMLFSGCQIYPLYSTQRYSKFYIIEIVKYNKMYLYSILRYICPVSPMGNFYPFIGLWKADRKIPTSLSAFNDGNSPRGMCCPMGQLIYPTHMINGTPIPPTFLLISLVSLSPLLMSPNPHPFP